LPWAVVGLLGALLAAPAAAAAAHLPRTLAVSTAAAGAALALAGAAAAGLPLAYTATLPVTLLGLALLRALPGDAPELYGAALVYVGCTSSPTSPRLVPAARRLLPRQRRHLFFGVTFTQRDRLHRFGRGVVYRVIVWRRPPTSSRPWRSARRCATWRSASWRSW
jgi:hypothetical protein